MDAALPTTLGELARSIAKRLERAGIPHDEARLDAELLLRSTRGWDRARWIVESETPASASLVHAIEPLARRRETREPMAYILGRCEFWGREFEVSPAVLIPRAETEIVVEQALQRIPSAECVTVFDMGTGSGCLAISIALARPAARIVATDVSAEAIEVARRNARRHSVLERIAFQHTTLLGEIGCHNVDLIVSNPPYVPLRERPTLQPEVRDHEPAAALFAGEDGLDLIRELMNEAVIALVPGGWLIFEFGFGQAGAVRELLQAGRRFEEIAIVNDLQGIPRTGIARTSPIRRALTPGP